MRNSIKIIGISGVAMAGKDSFFNILSQKVNCYRLAFADKLKNELRTFCQEEYGIDVFNCNPYQKEILRPLMVFHAKTKKKLFGEDYFIKELERYINFWTFLQEYEYLVITDNRYAIESDWIKSKGGVLIHIKKLINNQELPPANEEEATNDTEVEKMSDYKIAWSATSDLSILESYVDGFMAFLDARRTKQTGSQMPSRDDKDNGIFISGGPS